MNLQDLQNFDINDIDLNNMGSWPLPVKLIVLVVVFAGTLFGGYKYLVEDRITELDRVTAEEQELRDQFSRKQARAANLDAYKAQLEEMRRSFGAMLRQLPGETEVPNLLIDISQAGLASGLEQERFVPQSESAKEFYAELPIQIRLKGNFHQFGEFASSVAALPRIVTLHDISITGGSPNDLTMNVVAKTYRYIEDEQGGRR